MVELPGVFLVSIILPCIFKYSIINLVTRDFNLKNCNTVCMDHPIEKQLEGYSQK